MDLVRATIVHEYQVHNEFLWMLSYIVDDDTDQLTRQRVAEVESVYRIKVTLAERLLEMKATMDREG